MKRRLIPVLAVSATVMAALTAAPAEAVVPSCASGVTTDFNGDGVGDIVAGDSQATVDGVAKAGVIHVRYGNDDGITGGGASETIRQQESGAGLAPQADARFGSAIATADTNCDGYTDLLVGAPRYDLAGAADAGVAQLLLGGADGAGSGGTTVLTATDFGRDPEAGDQFGFAVDLLEDVTQSGTPAPAAYALAIGVPYRDSQGAADSGAVATLTPNGTGSAPKWLDQGTLAVPGAAESGDHLGSAVAFGAIDPVRLGGPRGDIDLLVGVPGEDIGSVKDAGAVMLLKGLYGNDLGGALAYDQGSKGVPGSVESGDQFGKVIEITRAGSTTYGVIGIPNEDIGSKKDAGYLQLFTGGSKGIVWGTGVSQDTSGVSGAAEAGDQFGADVAIATGSPVRLAVGVPGEDIGSKKDAGMVGLFRLDKISADVVYTQDSDGIKGVPQAGDLFGSAVAFVDGPTQDVLLVADPNDQTYRPGIVTSLPYPSGTPQNWTTSYGGSAFFGDALASEGR